MGKAVKVPEIKKEDNRMNMLTPFERRNYDIWGAFRDFEDSFFNSPTVSGCRTDIRDMGDRYLLESELPGFDKEDIRLDLDGDYLTVSAQRSTEKEEGDKNGNYLRRERSTSSYRRSFNIAACDSEKIDAEYRNGILTVTLPKKQEQQPAAKRLEIR